MLASPIPTRTMRYLLPSAILLRNVAAQFNGGGPGISAGLGALELPQLCNRTFADGNSSGSVSIEPGIGNDNSPITWATTVSAPNLNDTEDTQPLELSLWFSPGSYNYSNNFELGYDVCYFWISTFSFNTYVRAQNDTGDCTTALDETCTGDFLELTNRLAGRLTGVPSAQSGTVNLSTNSLPQVCTTLASQLQAEFPDSCKPYFNDSSPLPYSVLGGPPGLGGPLTGNQSLVERSQCETNDDYSLMWTQSADSTLENYFLSNYYVTPLITAFMPIADIARPVTLNLAKSFFTCVRSNVLNAGSIPIPPPPEPTPVNLSGTESDSSTSSNSAADADVTDAGMSSQGLSAGAIAGIVIGVLAILAVLAGAFFFYRRRKRNSNAKVPEMDGVGSNGWTQMEQKNSTQRTRAEAPFGSVVSEMGESRPPRAELENTKETRVTELP